MQLRDTVGAVWSNVSRSPRRVTIQSAPLLALNVILLGGFLLSLIGTDQIKQDFSRRGGDLVTIERSASEQAADFGPDVAAKLQRVPGVDASGSLVSIDSPRIAQSTADTKASEPELRSVEFVVSEDFLAVLDARYVQGRGFTSDDFELRRNVVVIGSTLAQSYGLDAPDSLPAGMRLGDQDVVVVGVVADNERRPELRRAVIVPHTALFLDRVSWDGAVASSPRREAVLLRGDISELEDLSSNTSFALKALDNRRFAVDYDSSLLTSYKQSRTRLLYIVQAATAVGVLVTFLASLQVQNSTMRLRWPELGTRLALGQRSRFVAAMLVGESLVVALAVWTITASIGTGVLVFVGRRFAYLTLSSVVPVVLAQLVLTLAIGVIVPILTTRKLTGLYPADLLEPAQ